MSLLAWYWLWLVSTAALLVAVLGNGPRPPSLPRAVNL